MWTALKSEQTHSCTRTCTQRKVFLNFLEISGALLRFQPNAKALFFSHRLWRSIVPFYLCQFVLNASFGFIKRSAGKTKNLIGKILTTWWHEMRQIVRHFSPRSLLCSAHWMVETSSTFIRENEKKNIILQNGRRFYVISTHTSRVHLLFFNNQKNYSGLNMWWYGTRHILHPNILRCFILLGLLNKLWKVLFFAASFLITNTQHLNFEEEKGRRIWQRLEKRLKSD